MCICSLILILQCCCLRLRKHRHTEGSFEQRTRNMKQLGEISEEPFADSDF